MDELIVMSSLGALALAVWVAVRERSWRPLLLAASSLLILLALLLSTGLAHLPWSGRPVARGAGGDPYALVRLYLASLAGMLSHGIYRRLEQPRGRRRKLDIPGLLAPLFVSPIVFLPLASAFEAVGKGQQSSQSHLMLLLVAYENGFFWREFFANRLKARAIGEEA